MIMEESKDLAIQTDRACLYTFFSRLFTDHTTAADLDHYISFLDSVRGDYLVLTRGLKDVLRQWSEKTAADHIMKTEYVRLFIMAGGIRPYESVYRGNEPLLMREPWLEVKEFYRRNGLVLENPGMHPEDHASVEFSFMAYLIENGGDLIEQREFFNKHLSTWLPQVCDDLNKHEHADFFKEMAVYATKFLDDETKFFLSIEKEDLTESDQRSDNRL